MKRFYLSDHFETEKYKLEFPVWVYIHGIFRQNLDLFWVEK